MLIICLLCYIFVRQRRLLAQIFSLPYVGTDVYRRMAVNNRRQRRKLIFWARPGRTAFSFLIIGGPCAVKKLYCVVYRKKVNGERRIPLVLLYV